MQISKRRPRGNDLHQTTIVTAAPAFRESLKLAVLGGEYGAVRPRKQCLPAESFSGPKARHRGPSAKEPDEVILEIRRLREDEGATASAISRRLAQAGIDVSPARVESITRYTTRAHLVPQSGHPPYINLSRSTE